MIYSEFLQKIGNVSQIWLTYKHSPSNQRIYYLVVVGDLFEGINFDALHKQISDFFQIQITILVVSNFEDIENLMFDEKIELYNKTNK